MSAGPYNDHNMMLLFWLYSRYILYLSFYKCVYNIVYTTFSFYSRALGTTAENVNVFWVVLILRPNIIFVVHVPYARRHSPTNIHDYFFFLYGVEKFFDSHYERFL